MGNEVSREKSDNKKMLISTLPLIAVAAPLYLIGLAPRSLLSLIPSSTAPLSLKSLSTVSQDGKPAGNEYESNMQLYKIKEKYSNLIIDQIQLAESQIDNKIANFVSAFSLANLNHWELIVTFSGHTIYWLISFGDQGLTNVVSLNKQSLIEIRKDQGNRITRAPSFKSGTKISDLISVIESVKNAKYNAAAWNCQHFTHHILQKIK